MHEWLDGAPLDLHTLRLFCEVADSASFTRAADKLGLTQSAVTRQIQGLEDRLGTALFQRTTRKVSLTEAGHTFLGDARRLLHDAEQAIMKLRDSHGNVPRVLRVGVSHSVGLAYLPGFFHAYRKQMPQVEIKVRSANGADLALAIAEHELDVAVMCPPKRLPSGVVVTHRFEDRFTFIVPPEIEGTLPKANLPSLRKYLSAQPWLLPFGKSVTATALRRWLKDRGLCDSAAMELDSFDLIINLVAQGMGVSHVPQRALALYHRLRPVLRVPSGRTFFNREMAVVVRREKTLPEHVQRFVDEILF